MKTLDTFSKRVLILAASISMVLLSATAFVLAIQRVTAAPAPKGFPSQDGNHYVGLGVNINKNEGYYMRFFPGGSFEVAKVNLPH